MSLRAAIALVVLLSPAIACAETEAEPPKPAGCPSEAHRGFDFWLGEWVVIGAKDRPVGHSRITKVLDGCAVLEEWYGFAYKGMSLNTYDPATKLWRQSWTDQNGTVLATVFDGRYKRMDKKLELETQCVAAK